MKLLKIIMLSSCLITICSCQTMNQVSLTSHDIQFVSTNVANQQNEFFENYYKANEIKYTIKDADKQLGWNALDSLGNQKLLVVPVQFYDAPKWTKDKLEYLYKVFFGDPEDTNWESVNSFFYKSSYGQLNLVGDVYSNPLVIRNYSTKRFNNAYQSGFVSPGVTISQMFYNEVDPQVLRDYDQDCDGYVDAVVFCYSNSYSTDIESVYWAWVDYHTNMQPNIAKPTFCTHMWISYNFIMSGYSTFDAKLMRTDTHTFIHETGHLLGLDDLYCYDEINNWNPAGELDMQSYNIGDHNIYSKMALGWVKPYVVTGDCTIKLNSSASTGDAILIKDGWNGSLYDEYLLIEFYTPTGLNEQDSKYSYQFNQMYNDYGLRIYHVDARLVKDIKEMYDPSIGWITTSNGYTDDFIKESCCFVGASNSMSLSYLPSSLSQDVRYVHLLDSGLNNKLRNGVVNSKDALWTENETFTPTELFFKNNQYFNDGILINYQVSVTKITDVEAIVSISKIK